LIGLILAARDINNYARSAGKSLNVIVFLRDDIYEWLRFEDKNKVTEGGAVRIEWDTRRTNRTLKELMAKRISSVLEVAENGGNGWEIAFNEQSKMRGHQTKYDHILARTMMRPRDMIKFCNSVLAEYHLETKGSLKFENAHVNSARSEYSRYLLAELQDEVYKHLPIHAEYFELLRELDAVQFDLAEFQNICEQRKDLLPDDVSAKTILADLFEFSVVGYYQPGGAGYGGAEFVFRYKSPEARFNVNANGFQVHLGLQEVLALKRYRRGATELEDMDSES
jgi:hypothetical protein